MTDWLAETSNRISSHLGEFSLRNTDKLTTPNDMSTFDVKKQMFIIYAAMNYLQLELIHRFSVEMTKI